MRFLWTFALWLTLLCLPFATLAAVDVTHGPSTHVRADHCTRACHDRGCAHLPDKVDVNRPVVRLARQVYEANIEALRAPSFGYRDTNLLVYVLGFPVAFALLLPLVLWPRRRPGPVAWAGLVASVGGLVGLGAVVASRSEVLLAWGSGRTALYWACTDACVHLGNLSGLTYEGFNFVLFVVGFPGTLLVLLLLTFVRGIRALGST